MIQRLFLFCLAFSWCSYVQAQRTEDPFAGMDGARVAFAESHADLGDMVQGEKRLHIFTFTNTGNQPLLVNNVITTCGCTAPEWPDQPIAPDKRGQLKVVFDSAGKIGRQNKVITMQSNALGQYHRVQISAMVLPPDKK